MTTNGQDPVGARLEQLLRTFGADVSRWPEADRALADERHRRPDLRALTREEAALDRMLGAAAETTRDLPPGLLDRVAAAATSTTPMPKAAADNIIPFRPRQRATPAPAPRRSWLQAGALLAACLMAGIVLGQSASVSPLLQDVAEQLGLAEAETILAIALDPTTDDGAL